MTCVTTQRQNMYKPMRKLSLFSGIGGLDLAAHMAGMRTVAFCEREPFPCRVLAHRFPGIPIYDDVRTLTAQQLKEDGIIDEANRLDLISAGYPCQPFSAAGKRRGENDDRHLWPEVARLLYELRPTWFIGENVAGHVSLGLDTVLSDLASIGYEAETFIIPACAVGAPHRRDRVFIVAYTEIPPEWSLDAGQRHDEIHGTAEQRNLQQLFMEHFGDHTGWERAIAEHSADTKDVGNPAEPRLSDGRSTRFDSAAAQAREGLEQQSERSGADVADAACLTSERTYLSYTEREGETRESEWVDTGTGSAHVRYASGDIRTAAEGGFEAAERGLGGSDHGFSSWLDQFDWPAAMGQPPHEWEPPRTSVGAPDRVARLKAIGNAVSPKQAFPIFYVIRQIHDYMHSMRLPATPNNRLEQKEIQR